MINTNSYYSYNKEYFINNNMDSIICNHNIYDKKEANESRRFLCQKIKNKFINI